MIDISAKFSIWIIVKDFDFGFVDGICQMIIIVFIDGWRWCRLPQHNLSIFLFVDFDFILMINEYNRKKKR